MRILCVDALGSGFCNLAFKNSDDDVFFSRSCFGFLFR